MAESRVPSWAARFGYAPRQAAPAAAQRVVAVAGQLGGSSFPASPILTSLLATSCGRPNAHKQLPGNEHQEAFQPQARSAHASSAPRPQASAQQIAHGLSINRRTRCDGPGHYGVHSRDRSLRLSLQGLPDTQSSPLLRPPMGAQHTECQQPPTKTRSGARPSATAHHRIRCASPETLCSFRHADGESAGRLPKAWGPSDRPTASAELRKASR